jgi:hypothetical protein
MTEPVRSLTPAQEGLIARLQHARHLIRESRDYARLALSELHDDDLETAGRLLDAVEGRIAARLHPPAMPIPFPLVGGAGTGVAVSPRGDAAPPADVPGELHA